jgi:hypothetical protein
MGDVFERDVCLGPSAGVAVVERRHLGGACPNTNPIMAEGLRNLFAEVLPSPAD